MEIDFKNLSSDGRYQLLTQVVVPRPIAWVTTLDENGVVNAAPFSFFNVFGTDPALVALGIGDREDGSPKDTARNIRRSREFVINLVTEELAERMVLTSHSFPAGTNELEEVGLTAAPSAQVKPPRIGASPVSLECRELFTQEIGGSRLIVGEVVHAAVADAFYDAGSGMVLADRIRVVGRMNGSGYARTRDRFEMQRPDSADDERFGR